MMGTINLTLTSSGCGAYQMGCQVLPVILGCVHALDM